MEQQSVEMERKMDSALMRIGELSRRVGVSEHVLRSWESRYGLLRPERSGGGYRLYSEDDHSRLLRMKAHLAGGLAAAQAARAVLADDRSGGQEQASIGALTSALDELDEPAAQALLDRLLTDLSVEAVLRDVLIPYLHELGERWKRGEASVAQEHFATHVIRGRLVSLSRGWGDGRGPYAMLACPPGEWHDLALIAFGIALSRCGWRVGYLGVDTPLLELVNVASAVRPSLVVLAATAPDRLTARVPGLLRLAGTVPLALAGAGATTELAERVNARLLVGDPVSAARQVAGSMG